MTTRLPKFLACMILPLLVSAALSLVMAQPAVAQVQIFFTDFNNEFPSQFSGFTTTTGVQEYAGIGTGTNVFGDLFLRNTTTGDPASKTILTLTGLSLHTSVELNFLLAIIDSWDGTLPGTGTGACTDCHPDNLTVTVDGIDVFFEAFGFNGPVFMPPPGVRLTEFAPLGFSGSGDAAYDMGLNPTFDNIPHTANSLTIEWFASGSGWQGGDDESWAIDNVEVILHGVNQPPNCSGAAPSVAEIWPPNHKFVGVNILGVTDPDDDLVTITVTKITQDEPLNTFGDGNFEPDGGGLGTSTAQVHAERSGSKKVPGNGRVYEISFTAADGNGGECSASVTVCVPHDQRPGHVCIDDGQLFNSVSGGAAKLTFPTDKVLEKAAMPDGYKLLQNYPNPFNPTTEIRFALPDAVHVQLLVYDVMGREVARLVDQPLHAGTHAVTWDASGLPGGTYLYRLTAGAFSQTKALTLLK